MTRTYTLLKLLEHGSVTSRELPAVTGWRYRHCRKTVELLRDTGRIVNVARGVMRGNGVTA